MRESINQKKKQLKTVNDFIKQRNEWQIRVINENAYDYNTMIDVCTSQKKTVDKYLETKKNIPKILFHF